jgi:glycerol-3-phosphate O-acyltransferase
LIAGRFRRYGVAAVTIGEPVALAPWFATFDGIPGGLFALPRSERLGHVQSLCDDVMSQVGALMPVTPVAVVCVALQTFDSDFVPRARLVARMEEIIATLPELNARPLRADASVGDTFDRAYELLRLRRVIARQADGYLILPRGRELISYYANGVAPVIGSYASAVRARDALPSDSLARALSD